MTIFADIEKRIILQAIVEHDFDLQTAADSLGISKRTVYRMLIRWKLPTPLGGRPETTRWSEHLKRCGKIEQALIKLKGENK